MSQRRVSTKLHHELKEYSSLLRALRVQDIMDVTKQLKQKNPFALARENVELEGLNSADDDEDTLFDSPRRLPQSDFGSPGPGPSSAAARRNRDQWTRWPLPLDDVLKTEWTLDDEVAFIVSQLLKTRPPRPAFPVPVARPDDPPDSDQPFAPRNLEFDPEDPDHPVYVPYITSVIAEYLSWLLALLAAHTPARAAGMQNRIEPLNWRAIIDVVVSCGVPEFSNTKIVSNVIERMEAIYGPDTTSYRAIERMEDKSRAQKHFAQHFNDEVTKYWQFDPLMVPVPSQPKLNKSQKMDERDFKSRNRWVGNASKARKATKAALKQKKVQSKREIKEKGKGKEKETEAVGESDETPVGLVALPTPPQTQSEEGTSTQPQPETTLRRSVRPGRSVINYDLKSFLPPVD